MRVQARDSQTAQQVDRLDPPPETHPALKTHRGRFSRRHIFALKLISEALRPEFSCLHVREGQRIPERLGVRQSCTHCTRPVPHHVSPPCGQTPWSPQDPEPASGRPSASDGSATRQGKKGNSASQEKTPYECRWETGSGAGRGAAQFSVIRTVLCAKLLQSRPTLCDPMDCSPQAPPSMGFSRQEHWSGLLTSHQSIESSVTVCSGEEPPWAKWPWPLRVVTQHHFHQHVSSCGR